MDVKANNLNKIVSATGGLAFAKTDSGNNAVALAGAFSYNGVDSTVNAFVCDSQITLRGVAFEDFVVETAEVRFSLTADNASDIWTLAAGGAGAVASGGTIGGGGGGSVAGSLAGSVSVNAVKGFTRARMRDSMLELESGPRRATSASAGPTPRTSSQSLAAFPSQSPGRHLQCHCGIGRRGHRRQQDHDRYRGARRVERHHLAQWSHG